MPHGAVKGPLPTLTVVDNVGHEQISGGLPLYPANEHIGVYLLRSAKVRLAPWDGRREYGFTRS